MCLVVRCPCGGVLVNGPRGDRRTLQRDTLNPPAPREGMGGGVGGQWQREPRQKRQQGPGGKGMGRSVIMDWSSW